MPNLEIVILIIAVALVFDFINGFHDAANSIATVVATRVLTPRLAVIWAAFFNFVALFIFGLHVAKTVGKGIVMPDVIDNSIIASALIGAIIWGLITWWKGIPSSSSHALIGGLIGAAMVKVGPTALVYSGISKTVMFIVLSPMFGFILAVIFSNVLFSLLKNIDAEKGNKFFRKAQLFSAAAYSLGHGGNDAQKTVGIISALLYSAGYIEGSFSIPYWVVLISYTTMGIGTLMGGFRIVKTMGSKLTKLKPVGGFIAETSGAITLFFASSLGVPVSTTHTITGSIVGVGSTKRFTAVRWPLASRIVWAWVFTIPASASIAALTIVVMRLF
jgi:PiT family inorganic phosphate transporter